MGWISVTDGRVDKLNGDEFEGSFQIGLVDFTAVEANPDCWAYLNGRLVWSPRPSAYHSWNGTAWAEDAGKLAEARSVVWERIKEYRSYRVGLGIQAGGHWFHSDLFSLMQHIGRKDDARDVLAAGGTMSDQLTVTIPGVGTIPVLWSTMSGAQVIVTCQLAFDIIAADKMMQGLCYNVAKNHKTAMMASADPWGYDFTTGWPAGYGE